MTIGIRDSGFGTRDSGSGKARLRRRSASSNPQCRASNPGRATCAGGFTLLEVIAAIVLLGIAFAALMKVAGASIALTRNASTHSAAALWARSALDSAFVTTPIKVGHSAGRFDRQFAWQLDVSPWGSAPDAGAAALYQLDLTVSWQARGGTNTAHFRTLRLGNATQNNPADGAVP
jgi:general secretion pathway protein I